MRRRTVSSLSSASSDCGSDLGACVTEEITQADCWYIDALTGCDTNNGRTACAAFKTYAEWQRRVGSFTVLNPTGGVLRINIMSDLPVTDPITFRNFIAAGATVFITGREKIVRRVTGTIVYGARDRSSPSTGGTPFEVTPSSFADDPSTAWDPYIRLMIKTADGAKAWILRNLGAETAHVGSWMQDVDDTATPFSVPYVIETAPDVFRDRPVDDSGFQIVDFSRVTLGEGLVGYEFAQSLLSPDFGPPGGVTLENLHSDGDTGQGDWTWWRSIGSNETLVHTRNVINDRRVEFPAGNANNIASHTLFTIGTLVMGGCAIQFEGCSWRPYAGFGGYPGGIRALPGSSITHDGDLSFVGDLSDLSAPQAADVQMYGNMNGGPISFWDTIHAFVVFNGGRVKSEDLSPFYNDYGYVPLWGDGNTDLMEIQAGGKIVIEQFNDTDPNPLPTLTFTGNPGVMSAGVVVDADQANRWDRLAVVYLDVIPTAWADLDIDMSAGSGFRDPTPIVTVIADGTETRRVAEMIRPDTDSHLIRSESVFVPV